MESFMESLNRLKDVHENEITGLQNKLLELNSERCRDAQRAEELCAKNRQLREQQRALKENLRALENRLRAGLCDRCMVTQELARKKQQEFESSLLQSLQHVFLLTTELTRLQEENDALKEEVKQLRGPGPKPQPREGAPDPPSPLLLPSLGTWKAVTEKPLGGREETEDNHAEPPAHLQPATRDHRRGAARVPGLLRQPGLRQRDVPTAAPQEQPPKPAWRAQPPSGQLPAGLSALCQALRVPEALPPGRPPLPPEPPPGPAPWEPSQRPPGPRRSPQRPPAPGPQGRGGGGRGGAHGSAGPNRRPGGRAGPAAGGSAAPAPGPAAVGPGAGGRCRAEGPTGAGEDATLPASRLPLGGSRGRGGRGSPAQRAAPTAHRPRQSRDKGGHGHTGLCPGQASGPLRVGPGPGRRPQACQPARITQPPRCPHAQPQATPGSGALCTVWGPGTQRRHQGGQRARGGRASTFHGPSLPSPSGPGDEDRGRPKLPLCAQRPDGDSHPELSKAQGQRPESDELDKPDTSDSEVGLSTEAGATRSSPAEGPRGFCAKERGRGPQKRKRASDQWSKASKKPS
ncbi:RBBP8 N-terminal-like protein isoform X2 [Balaenoptera ricei]|uniref:RBBP8 N-terminal-like protein isoform X2 n=1 Tax=Balaenoptera ricei TaxID=2746895 RepID=UPI0028BD35B8|nr:RBBP8 N-terminal-like protein isoform X2 [Balaenoptera ricei]